MVVVGKGVSAAYDWLAVDPHLDAVAERTERDEAEYTKQGLAAKEMHEKKVLNNCARQLAGRACTDARDMAEAGRCLRNLRRGQCERVMPMINVCAAVQGIETCADPFINQKKNGCERLRKTAGCAESPAPADLDGYFMLTVRDGILDEDL